MAIDREMEKRMWCVYTMEYYLAMKRTNVPFAKTWMDLDIIILSEVSQRESNIIGYHLFVES